jgi:large subunit ribosomal protein L14
MIQDGSIVKITDNAGGKVGKVFKVPGGSKKRYAGLGDVVIISIKVAEPRKQIKKKDVVPAVIVRTKNAHRRKDGSYIRFDDNAVVILNKDQEEPIAGRVFGPIPREVGEKGFQKIISLAPEVL